MIPISLEQDTTQTGCLSLRFLVCCFHPRMIGATKLPIQVNVNKSSRQLINWQFLRNRIACGKKKWIGGRMPKMTSQTGKGWGPRVAQSAYEASKLGIGEDSQKFKRFD